MIRRKLTTAQIAVLVAIGTFSSNCLGFVREMILANYFGAGMVTDAFVMGTSIPNTLMAAIIGSAGVAYMPILASKFEKQGESEANKFTSQVINLMFVCIAVVFIIVLLCSGFVVGIFAPGYKGEKQALTVFYMRFAFAAMLCNTVISFIEAYLRYRGIFVAQKWIALFQNIFAISFIVIAAAIDYHLIIAGTVLGLITNCIGDIILGEKAGFRYSLDFDFKGPVNEVVVLALPIFVGGSISEINTFIDKMLASNLAEGSVTALNYSGRLVLFIMTFTVGIFSTIIYPKLNQSVAQGDTKRISDLTESGINLLSLLTIPFSLGAIVYSEQIVKIVYERGAFTGVATELVSMALMYYSIRIPFYGVSQLLNNDFYAMHDSRSAVYCSVVAMVVNIALNLALVGKLGIAGLALATSASEIVGMVLRYISFSHKYKEITLLRSKRKLAKIILFSIISVGISYVVYILLGFTGSIFIRTGLAVVSAVALYMLLLVLAKFEELKLIRDLFARG